MHVVITYLGAPWPDGAVVGSVVALPGDDLPGWAVGKCRPAEEGAEPEFEWQAAAPPSPASPAAATSAPVDADELRALKALLDESRTEAGELRAMLAEQAEKIAEQDEKLAEQDEEIAKQDEKIAALTAAAEAPKKGRG